MTEGLDVYGRYNSVTSWAQVNGAKDFVWVKVSDGTTLKNGLGVFYDYGYVGAANAAGLPAGGYHYAQFGDPVAQANLFIDRCEALGATAIAPMLDLESPFVANQAAIDFAVAFCKRVIARGHKPALYANNSMLTTVRGPFKAAVPNSYIVVARYGANPTVSYDDWQFTSSGTCPGIAGVVDLDTGIMPTNTGAHVVLDANDQKFIQDNTTNNIGWWYTPRFRGNENYAQVMLGVANAVPGLVTSLAQLKDLVIASDANDVTADALAHAVVPLILPDLEQGLRDAVANVESVSLTPDQITAIASATANVLGQRLATPAPPAKPATLTNPNEAE